MSDIVRISFTFLVILLFLRKKWNVGVVLLIASLFLVFLYVMKPYELLHALFRTITSPVTIKLLLALIFIRIFEIILRERDVMKQMMASVKRVIRRKKGVIVSMPLIIGILPSVGGAYFSAPMVEEAAKGTDLTPESKTFLNYWYRHPWEMILPLYPGIVLASALLNIELRYLIMHNLICAFFMVTTGVFFGMREIRGNFDVREDHSFATTVLCFSPILVLLALVLLFHLSLHYALMLTVAGLLVLYRYSFTSIRRVFAYGFSKDVFLLIFGVMLFKEILESSHAVSNLSAFLVTHNIPMLPLLFIIPFLCGLLTGLTVGFVAGTFPLLLTLPGLDVHAYAFAFVSGYAGVLLSPVHVCLILTREYFGADFPKVYKKIVPATVIMFTAALVEFLVMSKCL